MILDIMPIPLTQGLFALVDGEDYEELSKYKWHAAKRGEICYAEHSYRNKGKKINILMHRMIMNASQKKCIDHINCCGLDNRKTSLRFATKSQNQANSRGMVAKLNRTSKYKGVSWHKGTAYKGKRYKGKWTAQFCKNGQLI
ncbi:unnamed protein product, partial [marine sediment metagenome]